MNQLNFSPGEKRFFANQRQQFNAMQLAINNAISLLVSQNDLEGEWGLNQDWTGLQRADSPTPNPAPPPMPAEVALEPHVESSRERRTNGTPL